VSDIADYCRQVEAHLTRINGGHLVRVVGAGFALVKEWCDAGVPLSVVFRAIEQKAERHQAGASKRPLRIEFCETDVRALFVDWQRAIGMTDVSPSAEPADSADRAKPKAASKVIERAIERLGRLAGRLDLSEGFRDAASLAIEELSALRDALAGTRGAARQQLLEGMAPIDRSLLAAARQAVASDALNDLRAQAEQELAPYRGRLSPEAWEQAVTVTVDRGLRALLKLPTLEP
jgi:hypothetical protein